MFRLFLVATLLIACSPKTYTEPKIGMDFVPFHDLCGYDVNDSHRTITTADGDTSTIKTISTDTRSRECVGTFTFVNGKLTVIEH